MRVNKKIEHIWTVCYLPQRDNLLTYGCKRDTGAANRA